MKKCAVLLAVSLLSAQYPPGQYTPATYPRSPYPGQNPPPPPGQAPPGQTGPPVPGSVAIPKRDKKNQKGADTVQATIEADGRTVSREATKLVVATNDGRTLTMTVTPATSFTGDIAKDAWVHVVAAEDGQAFLTALTVNLLKDVPRPADVQNQQAQADPAAIGESASEAPGRPILRRGKPKQTDSDDIAEAPAPKPRPAPAKPKSDSVDFTITAEDAAKSAVYKDDARITQTREWAASFTQGLPNFVCQQVTTRYLEESKSSGWQPLDVITSKVIYEDGKEKYQEITVGGKRTNKGMMELGGSTSTGEFASILMSLFDGQRAQFRFSESTSLTGGVAAAVYDFKVPLRHSDWTITVGGQSLMPAYNGSVWIEKTDPKVRRIEMQAIHIPKDFPDDAVESTVDYDQVRLGERMFLVPVHAEILSCQRGTTICTKNAIDFRDYHKFSGESTIEFK
jgi:hypothetical protein